MRVSTYHVVHTHKSLAFSVACDSRSFADHLALAFRAWCFASLARRRPGEDPACWGVHSRRCRGARSLCSVHDQMRNASNTPAPLVPPKPPPSTQTSPITTTLSAEGAWRQRYSTAPFAAATAIALQAPTPQQTSTANMTTKVIPARGPMRQHDTRH